MRPFATILGSYILLCVSSLHAQGRWSAALTPWVSGTRAAAIETRQGLQHDRALTAFGVRAAWPLLKRRNLAVEYVADLIPVVVTTANRAYRWRLGPCTPPDCTDSRYRDGEDYVSARWRPERYTSVGFGVAPLGAQVRLSIAPPVNLTTAATAGALYFSRPVPDYEAARFNFVGEIGAGAELTLTNRRALAIGYRFQHISNAGTAPLNMGVDSHLLAIGLVFSRSR